MIKAYDVSYSRPHAVYIVGVINSDTLLIADSNYLTSDKYGMGIRPAKREDLRIPLPRIPLFDAPTEELKHVASDQPNLTTADHAHGGKWK